MSVQYDMVESSEIKFISSIGSLGQDRMIINIPKKFHEQARKLKEKQVIVIIKEALID
jgi:hypothetical protein